MSAELTPPELGRCQKKKERKEECMYSRSSDATYQLFVGVDIAAVTATVAWQVGQHKPSKPITIEQTPEGFDSLHQRLMKTGAGARPEQILGGREAAGGYWLSVATFFGVT